MEKVVLDNMLDLIQLNKSKIGILEQMMTLEYQHKEETEDYYAFIDLYKKTASSVIKITDEFDLEERSEIMKELLAINPEFYRQVAFSQTLTGVSEQYLAVKKTFMDLGTHLLQLYYPKKSISNPLKVVLSMLGMDNEEENNDIDPVLANSCMVSDFTNILYSEVNKFLNFSVNEENRILLLRMKYNLIYLSSDIEKRAILTSFSIPENPSLIDADTIYKTGMTKAEYLDSFDTTMVRWLELLVNDSLYHTDFRKEAINLTSLVFIKAFASSLSDKELIDCIPVEVSSVCNENCATTIALIKEALSQSKIDLEKNKELRKYQRI